MARSLLVLLTILIATSACWPAPSDPVEYLHREDSIIIQLLTVNEEATAFERRLAAPEFTLYGDGTLIYQEVTADGTRLLQTSLPEEAIQELLEDIVDEDFLNFTYEQPAPDGASNATTFLYAHTLDRANAVSVQGVSAPLPANADDEFDQYRDVREFVETLRALDPVALGGSEPAAYVADVYLLVMLTVDGALTEREIRSDELVELLAGSGRRSESALEDLVIPIHIDPGYGPAIRIAPLLPFHGNSPEFELQ